MAAFMSSKRRNRRLRQVIKLYRWQRQAAALAHELHAGTTGRAGATVRRDTLSGRLHARRAQPETRAQRGQGAGVVSEPAGQVPKTRKSNAQRSDGGGGRHAVGAVPRGAVRVGAAAGRPARARAAAAAAAAARRLRAVRLGAAIRRGTPVCECSSGGGRSGAVSAVRRAGGAGGAVPLLVHR